MHRPARLSGFSSVKNLTGRFTTISYLLKKTALYQSTHTAPISLAINQTRNLTLSQAAPLNQGRQFHAGDLFKGQLCAPY
jgi:hypothetical protein